jgi:hypothetical protein
VSPLKSEMKWKHQQQRQPLSLTLLSKIGYMDQTML